MDTPQKYGIWKMTIERTVKIKALNKGGSAYMYRMLIVTSHHHQWNHKQKPNNGSSKYITP